MLIRGVVDQLDDVVAYQYTVLITLSPVCVCVCVCVHRPRSTGESLMCMLSGLQPAAM